MSLTALIVDDEQLARAELRYLLENAGGVEILAEGANGIEAVHLIQTHKPDVVFLDVQMPGLDGFAVIKKLLEKHQPAELPQMIFATAFDQYAVRAFEVNAVDYLLKPFDQARVQQTIEKAQKRFAERQATDGAEQMNEVHGARLDALVKLLSDQNGTVQTRRQGKVVIRTQNRLLLVDPRDICYASIEDGTISVATQTLEGSSTCRTLEELMDQLDSTSFWRAHRSYVVNIEHISEVVPWFKSSYQLRMDDRAKKEIPVSRAQTKRLRELFNL
ncbi:MAG: response regulator [Acidobacteriaceae bacterium]|jgi:DNA-binding LytR/AlgR family response regulator|nr:response regulator [Acidobacteriaceae bacterium]